MSDKPSDDDKPARGKPTAEEMTTDFLLLIGMVRGWAMALAKGDRDKREIFEDMIDASERCRKRYVTDGSLAVQAVERGAEHAGR
jgi:hypothetical protein